uniref:Uncharacterized protein n=1 Tax=Vespula pensylvanica TaxID=30213 RepID=A0A834K1G8_VESPE|nr:hypothetical protein H0235_016325 [Vespula pensylvanica]
MYSLIKGKHGIKYAVEITNRFTALEKINESNDNMVDKQWGNVCENRRKSRLVFVRGIKINRGDECVTRNEECVKVAKIPNEAHIILVTQNTDESRDQFLNISDDEFSTESSPDEENFGSQKIVWQSVSQTNNSCYRP